MKRRDFLFTLAASFALAGAGHAATFAEQVIAQLTRQGFGSITTDTTWLGRVRIMAERNGGQREIVLNPRTGEILRDIWIPAKGGSQIPILDDVSDDGGSGGDDLGGDDDSSGHGSGGDGDDNSGHGSGDDDDDDDDNSGHGSGGGGGGDDRGGKGKD
jgi:hypothetical protein